MTAKKIISLSASPEGFGQTPDTLESEMFVSALPIQHTDTYYENEELGLYDPSKIDCSRACLEPQSSAA